MTVYVSIGNSDDKLSQARWADFCDEVDRTIEPCALTVHGAWFSLPTAHFQNACWCFEPDPDYVGNLKRYLASTAMKFDQDSIAWAEVKATEFLGGER